jgi:hypothetical protein
MITSIEWTKEQSNEDDTGEIKQVERFLPALEQLTHKTRKDIPYREAHIRIHNGTTGINGIVAVDFLCKTIAQIHQNANHIPGRQTNQNSEHVFAESRLVVKEHQEIAPAGRRGLRGMKHAALGNTDPQ